MSSTNPEEILKKLEYIYLNSTYLDKHGTDLWVSIILCILFLMVINIYYYSNVLEVVKVNWNVEKCNPLFMPFAGFINKPVNQSNFEFTGNNFVGCIRSVLEGISISAFNPFQAIINILNEVLQEILSSINMIRGLIYRLRRAFEKILSDIQSIVFNLVIEFQSFIIKFRDTMGKVNGILITALYVMFGAFMTLKSLFLSILDFLTLILIAIAAIILVYICIATGLFPIPFIGAALATPTIIVGIITALIMLMILIIVIIFEVFMMKVLNLSTPPLPSVPSCFAGDTLIPLFEEGKEKCIKDIRTGDQLKNGGIVTATMQFTAEGQNLYKLNDVFVTGEHRVFHPILQWIKVKNHPESQYIPDFKEPYVYCLNTDAKEFVINETVFSDWDDIDAKVLNDLQANCVSRGYLPENFTYADIHTYIDSGFAPDTAIKLVDGSTKPISEVKINDVLYDANGVGANGVGANGVGANGVGANVMGIIKIDGRTIKQYKHSVGNVFISGTKIIHMNNLGISMGEVSSEATPILYHLLTDTKFFVANGITVNDYNYGIDAYLN